MWKTPESVGLILQKRYLREAPCWLNRAARDEPFAVQSFSLAVPKGQAAEDIVRYNAWEEAWKNCRTPGIHLTLKPIAWHALGRTEHLVGLDVLSLKAAFSLMPDGDTLGRAFRRALIRAEPLRTSSNQTQRALESPFLEETRFLLTASDAEFTRMCSVLSWLTEHPKADCYIRELPIEGVDTKWFENNQRKIARFMSAVLNLPTPMKVSEVAERWHLLTPPALIRLRHADAIVPSLPSESLVALPVSVLEKQPVRQIAVVENLQTGLALTVPEDVLIVTGMGAAVRVLSEVSWCKNAAITYMGDLDQHGLTILAELRCALPHVRSVMMTLTELKTWRHLAVTDPTPPLAFPKTGLTDEEAELLSRLQTEDIRLEQERIPIAVINAAFQEALRL